MIRFKILMTIKHGRSLDGLESLDKYLICRKFHPDCYRACLVSA